MMPNVTKWSVFQNLVTNRYGLVGTTSTFDVMATRVEAIYIDILFHLCSHNLLAIMQYILRTLPVHIIFWLFVST